MQCGAKKDAEPAEKKAQENYDDGLNPQVRMEAIKEIFKKADESGDKLVDMEEWLKATKEKDGEKYDEKAAKEEFKIIDQSNSGTISLAELDLWVKTKQLDAVRVRFKSADKSGDRRLDEKEFQKFFKAEGMKKKAIGKLWKKCDVNKDGKVSYTEFSDWMEREMADGVLAETFGFDANELNKKKEDKKAAKEAKAKEAKKK